MEFVPVELDPQVLRPLRRIGRYLALACAAVSIATAAVHLIRDGQPGWAALVAGAAGASLAAWWWPMPAPRLTSCRRDAAGWHVHFDGRAQAFAAQVTGVAATQRHLILRIQVPHPPVHRPRRGARWDELFWVDGDLLGDAQWTRLRSTLRLTVPDITPLA